MIWPLILFANIVQGAFLLSLFALKRPGNALASRFITALMLSILITNADFFIVASDAYRHFPYPFGMSFGMMLLMGPLFYLYIQATMRADFRWRARYCFHFLPFALNVVLNVPIYVMPPGDKQLFISFFLSGNLPLRAVDICTFLLQDLVTAAYILAGLRSIYHFRRDISEGYVIAIDKRSSWLQTLGLCLTAFLVSVFLLFVYLLAERRFIATANYVYTIVISGVVYFVGYKFFLDADLLFPDFTRKYKSLKKSSNDDDTDSVTRIRALLETKRIFLDSDLKIADMAAELQLPSHRLSMIINEQFRMSFNDLINEYRVNEFITRVNDPKFSAYTILGIGMDVGFNSKSSFNAAFKKVTGKTPSAYKNS